VLAGLVVGPRLLPPVNVIAVVLAGYQLTLSPQCC